MSKERVSIRLSPQLRDEIDEVRAQTGESRNGFIEAACHERLERLRTLRQVEKSFDSAETKEEMMEALRGVRQRYEEGKATRLP